jgi:hypothetical protein
MSKKLIAVASAAALALTALVGVAPANANVVVAIAAGNNADSGAGTSASPYLESVPVANVLTALTSIQFDVTTVVGQTMTVTATGAVRILPEITGSAADNLFTTASGTTTYTEVAESTTTSFIAYNTSTTAGTIQISLKSPTTSASGDLIYIKGVKGTAYNYNMTAPASIATGAAGELTFTVTDMFGNVIEDDDTEKSTILSSVTIAGVSAPSKGPAVSWDSSRKVYYLSIAAQSTTTPFGVTLSVASITDVGGLAKAKDTAYAAINSPAAAAANASLTSQVAALTAQVAGMVTKKRFNKLARKWNAAFPSQKVKLKK